MGRERVRCYYCCVILTEETLTTDHKTPRSRGGGGVKRNLVPACFECNQAKADESDEEFLGRKYCVVCFDCDSYLLNAATWRDTKRAARDHNDLTKHERIGIGEAFCDRA